MNTTKQRIGLAAAGVLAAVSLWGCQATRNSDGSITVTFAPDMVIHAFGLEGAIRGINDLLRDCLAGTFGRPCTPAELREIRRARNSFLRAKDGLIRPA
ncbi:MAG TPA: hypothetical protein VF530_15075 [Planctomycetota bacterium]